MQADDPSAPNEAALPAAPSGPLLALRAPLAAQLVSWQAAPGQAVAAGAELLLLEAMKLEHVLVAPCAGRLAQTLLPAGALVEQDALLGWFEPAGAEAGPQAVAPAAAAAERDDLRRLRARLALTEDAARPQAIAKRHALGLRSARENLADLLDPGSFSEYGALAVAAQRRRRSLDDLQRNTPADGLIAGIGSVNAARFGAERARCAVLAYDATVLAGTQGMVNHHKADRLLELAARDRLPLVLLAEGGGGRPGDVDSPTIAGLHVGTFAQMAALSGQVPSLALVAGRCFAGNAALAGCCDLIVATAGSNLGMGGPAMIEGGGLGRYPPEAIGPAAEQAASGGIDLLVADEREGIAALKRLLSMFQGRLEGGGAAPAEAAPRLRAAVPENRARAYDPLAVVEALVDAGSAIELRAQFGGALRTFLARLDGRPLGLLASDPRSGGGAVDADAADKGARFMQLCDAHGLPIVALVDTPGFMVGPEAERRAQVRHASRLFVAAAALEVPYFAVVLRRGFGLGAMALAGGGFHAPRATLAWPGAEFGAMGLEGAVRLGYRAELDACADAAARQALFDRLLAEQIERGAALNMASMFEIDAVVDPADTRAWLLRGLEAAAARPAPGARVRRRFVDSW
jgi:acetyl-CoA carboxylase carboxyltransferase component